MPGNENSGRPRKPTSLKILTGTFQNVRANKHEPKPKIARPKAPKGLNSEIKKVFDELVEITFKMGVLSQSDGIALEMCARAICEYRIASDVLIKEGPDIEYKTKDGKTVLLRRSEVVWAESAFRRASSMLAKFGLSPSDRSRVDVVNPAGSESKWAEFKKYD